MNVSFKPAVRFSGVFGPLMQPPSQQEVDNLKQLQGTQGQVRSVLENARGQAVPYHYIATAQDAVELTRLAQTYNNPDTDYERLDAYEKILNILEKAQDRHPASFNARH